MSEQLGLWPTRQEERAEQSHRWHRMYDEFQASLNTPDEITKWGMKLKQLVCLRCGQPSYYGTIDINHDLGYCGCPTDHDPTWSRYEKAPGFQCVYMPDGSTRSMLTDEEMCDRWENGKTVPCICGHAFGLHQWGSGCHIYCGCDGYEASAPTTTH
jgi:hypothetical protein